MELVSNSCPLLGFRVASPAPLYFFCCGASSGFAGDGASPQTSASSPVTLPFFPIWSFLSPLLMILYSLPPILLLRRLVLCLHCPVDGWIASLTTSSMPLRPFGFIVLSSSWFPPPSISLSFISIFSTTYIVYFTFSLQRFPSWWSWNRSLPRCSAFSSRSS